MRRGPAPDRQRSRANPFTVSEVLGQVQECLGDNFRPLLVRGEVRDARRPRGGHLYLTLEDPGARLRVVVFAGTLARIPHTIANGDSVLVWGRITAYPRTGDVQLVADFFEPVGLGSAWAQREALRKRLAGEGLFAAERKRPLPWIPRAVGVVTSPTGSALQDVLSTIERRFPRLRIVLAPARVHGAAAGPEVAAAIAGLDARGAVDVILVVRGGGSREDLAAFDAEEVVRAAAACKTPLVSGVGHEDDVTLLDLVADRRAPTPTGAAELAVPRERDLLEQLTQRERRLQRAVTGRLAQANRQLTYAARSHGMQAVPLRLRELRRQLVAAERRLALVEPRARLAADRVRVEQTAQRLRRAMTERLVAAQRELTGGARHLESLSPLKVLGRGYSLTSDEQGNVVRSTADLAAGDVVRTRLADGAFRARVEAVEPLEPGAGAG